MHESCFCQENDIMRGSAGWVHKWLLQWAQTSEQNRAPTLIQTPLKEQWAESEITKSLSLQPVCYVILEFGKYYVSEQLRIPRSFTFMIVFSRKACSEGYDIFSLSVVYDSCFCSPVQSLQLILPTTDDIPSDPLDMFAVLPVRLVVQHIWHFVLTFTDLKP